MSRELAGKGSWLSTILQVHHQAGLHDGTYATHAPTSCTCAASCWKGEPDSRRPPLAPASRGQAYRPWIGAHYEATRLVVLGENFYDHGGWDEAEQLVRWVMPRLARGIRRMNFGVKRYKGSLFQHRAALYARVWLEALGFGAVPIGEVYEHVAFTNAVKCSPRATEGTRSTPNPVMWSSCPRHVLAGELAALGARRIVVIGTSSNAGAMRAHVWTDLFPSASSGRVQLLRSPDGREALVVPHPASPGGAAASIENDVRAVLFAGR